MAWAYLVFGAILWEIIKMLVLAVRQEHSEWQNKQGVSLLKRYCGCDAPADPLK